MAIYLINLCFLFYWNLLVDHIKIKNKNLVKTFLMGTQYFLLFVLRDITVGADTYVYIRRFYIISTTKWSDLKKLSDIVDFEIGFIYLNKLIGNIFLNERFFLFVIGLISIGGISFFIYKNSKNVFMSFFIFSTFGFFGNSLNTLRQFIAIIIIVYSIKYIKNNSLIKFLILILLATTIHTSAIFFLIIYPISKIKINKKYILLIFISWISVYYLSTNIINFAINKFGYLSLSARLNKGSGMGILFFLLLIFIVALFYRKDVDDEEKKKYDLYIHILFIGILLNILALEFAMFGRAMLYYTIITIVLIPEILNYIKIKNEKITFKILFIGILSYFYIFKLLKIDSSSIIPYEFFEFF